MRIDLTPYSGKRICVAVSGGRDSMALLHYMHARCNDFEISLSALNCDHAIRGEESTADSAFVAAYCGGNDIKLYRFKAEIGALNSEEAARRWRLSCYENVLSGGEVDFIATAHHMNDNAETVLFNLARGSSLKGLTGISDNSALSIIRPLLNCSRREIDEYIAVNGVPFVTDSTNETTDYTRNKIRLNVIPALEEAVPDAVASIARFARLAAEDEEYFSRLIDALIVKRGGGYLIRNCGEKVVFRRAARRIVAEYFGKKDYTSGQFERLFALQCAECGKRFGFLSLVAVKENGGVFISEKSENDGLFPLPIDDLILNGSGIFGGQFVYLVAENEAERAICEVKRQYGEVAVKVLRLDLNAVRGAEIRFRRCGDRFKKFAGGEKSLGDYLTDKKVPQGLRETLPLICKGDEVLAVGGVEISDVVKVTAETKNAGVFICSDPFAIG